MDVYAQKKVIDNAYHQVHTLGKPKEKVPFYQEPKTIKMIGWVLITAIVMWLIRKLK
jgi:hypothetical protein